MSEAIFTLISNLNKDIHEPARLAILSVLYTHSDADFTYLQGILGLTNGNLNSHLARLERYDYIRVHKGYLEKRPHTTYWLSSKGRQRFEAYLETISVLLKRINA